MKSTITVSLAGILLCFVSTGDAAEMKADRIELSPQVRAKCLSVLRTAVRSEEFWPSMHAAEALSLGGYGSEVRKLLEPKLKTEKDDQHRCGLARELVRAGDTAKTKIMLDILAGKNDYGHVHACESLYKVNQIGDGKLLLAAMKQTKNTRLAIMAAAALGRKGNKEAFVLLRKHVNHTDDELARTAAWVLARIGDNSDIPLLKAKLKTLADPLSRAYFEHALATLGDKAGLAALERNLTHKDPVVRIYAATFAGDARALGVKDKLIALLDHENIDVRVRAAQSLLVLSQKTVGPWKLDTLYKSPTVEWIKTDGLVRSLYYAGEPYRGKPTRVFAYFGLPENVGTKKLPAMVLVHGGGGTAFPEWAELWAKRGYVCIAMDLSGRGPERKRLADGGPEQSHKEKFDDIKNGIADAWPYHAVANVVRAISVLHAHPNVDPNRIGITGISWGGYLTSIVCGVDDRLKAAVPVYGCGFLHKNSAWLKDFDRLGKADAKLWVDNFDPSRYLANCRMPTLWVNGTNDFAYPLDSYRKSYSQVKGPRTIRVTVKMPHGHRPGWAPKEIGMFIDSIFLKKEPLPTVSGLTKTGNKLTATFQSAVPVKSARLHFTVDKGPWQKREWQTVPANITKGIVFVDIGNRFPKTENVVCFITLTDERGAIVSTEHLVASGKPIKATTGKR